MSKFISTTMYDIRGGRDSWRVLLTFTLPSFFVAVAAVIVHPMF